MTHLHSLKTLQLIYGLAFLALILLTGFLGTAGLVFAERGSQEAKRISVMVGMAESARGDLYRQMKEVFDFHFLDDPDALDQYRDYNRRLGATFDELSAVVATPAEEAAIGRLISAYQAVRDQTDGIMAHAGGTVPEADQLALFDTELEGEGLTTVETAFAAAEELLLIGRDGMEARTASLTQTAIWVLVVPLGLAAILLLVARVYLQRALIKPLSGALDAMAAFGDGKLNHRAPLAGAAEMVALQTAINRMAGDLADSREALLTTEKQAALGALVPVIAHNIRNPLASIRATAQVSQTPELAGEVRDGLQAIVGQVDRLETWLGSLLSYLDPLSPDKRSQDLSQCIGQAVRMLEPQLAGRDVEIAQTVAGDPPIADIDAHLVEQAIYGLVSNAVDASPAGGRIKIACGGDPHGCWLQIDDQGPGMSVTPTSGTPAPGPSTKSFGSGIGIPFAYKVSQLHAGDLIFTAAPGGGTRVRMTFPTARTPQ